MQPRSGVGDRSSGDHTARAAEWSAAPLTQGQRVGWIPSRGDGVYLPPVLLSYVYICLTIFEINNLL